MHSISGSGWGQTNLHKFVPSSRHDDGVGGVRAEADARNPLGVALFGDGELAVAKGVPELDGAISGPGNNLAVVGREGHRQDVVGVPDEAAGGEAG